MSNMSYCRHENTLRDLLEVIEQWDNFDPSEHDENSKELKAYKQLEKLINWGQV